MTNSEVRKKAVITALDLLISVDTQVKVLAQQRFPFFNGIKDTDIAVANLAWFFLHYNSITLRDPLNLAFDEMHSSLKLLNGTQFEKDRNTKLYQLFCIAATLNTGRLKDTSKIDILFNEDKILTNSLFVYLFEEAINILEFENEAKIRKDFKLESKKIKYSRGIRFLLDNKSEDLVHTTFEKLSPLKKVELFTEGRTDASIISHAFRVLTLNDEPYWNITAVENIHSSKAGGAQQLGNYIKKLAENIETDFDKCKTVIGVFDNDSKGYQEFKGLPDTFKLINGIVKKHDQLNIYALLLPIPGDDSFKPYIQEKQSFKFFEIEHYFEVNLLKDYGMIEETSIPGVFEITGGKTDFKQEVLKLIDPFKFRYFVEFFTEIDKLNEKTINYIEKNDK
jgi:hypothetical protein